MQVILKEDVHNLGKAGEVVTVRPGYGRNFLIPQNKAATATKGNVAAIEHQKKLIEEKRAEFEARQKQHDAFSKSHFPEGAQLCNKCSTAAVVMMDGCMTCLNCGESKCG